MALTPSSSSPALLQSPLSTHSTATHCFLFSDLTVSSSLFRSPWAPSLLSSSRRKISAISPIVVSRAKCSAKSTAEEDLLAEPETLDSGGDDDDVDDAKDQDQSSVAAIRPLGSPRVATSLSESLSLGIREPVYEVVEVTSNGMVSTRKINRRQLLKSSGLRPRDIRSVDPSLFLTNSVPSLLVVEAALLSRIQHLEQILINLEPRVQALLEVLPNRLTGDILEELRTSKQTLVELGSRAGALRQMLLDLLEDPHEIRRICIMGRNCTLKKGSEYMECSVPLEKQIAEDVNLVMVRLKGFLTPQRKWKIQLLSV